MATLATERDHRPVFGLRLVHWMMVGIIALALGGGTYTLRGGAMVAYVSIAEARVQ